MEDNQLPESEDNQDSLEQTDDPLKDSLNMHDYHKDWTTCAGEVPKNKETQTIMLTVDSSTQTDESSFNSMAMKKCFSSSAETQTDEKLFVDKGIQDLCSPLKM